MNKSLITAAVAALWLSGCVIAPPGRVGFGVRVPALPVVVELGSEPYYVHGGYTYFYDNDRWRYADSRAGPWVELPRSHYPRETRYRGRPDRRERDRDRDRDRDGVPDRRDAAPNDPRYR